MILKLTTWYSKQPFVYWMFGETTISYVKNWSHPIETTTNKWMFGVPGIYVSNGFEVTTKLSLETCESWNSQQCQVSGVFLNSFWSLKIGEIQLLRDHSVIP